MVISMIVFSHLLTSNLHCEGGLDRPDAKSTPPGILDDQKNHESLPSRPSGTPETRKEKRAPENLSVGGFDVRSVEKRNFLTLKVSLPGGILLKVSRDREANKLHFWGKTVVPSDDGATARGDASKGQRLMAVSDTKLALEIPMNYSLKAGNLLCEQNFSAGNCLIRVPKAAT